MSRRVVAPALLAAALAGACAGPRPTAGARAGPPARREVESNVSHADYAGSRACEPCHAELSARWARAPMHRMTRPGDAPDVRAPFDGRRFAFKDDEAELVTASGRRFVRVREGGKTALHRVTKVIGGRVREDFAGVPVADPQSPATGVERILPVSYFIDTGELRYKGYSVQAVERPGMRTTASWREACLFCHNTVPLLSSSLGHLAGKGGYQGSDLDALLPEARRAPLVVDDPAGLARALRDERRRLGARDERQADLSTELRRTISATRAGFGVDQLVELGIGCEACHNGSKAHVDDPTRLPSFEPRSPWVHRSERAGDARAQAINQACARCHQVLFSRYPHTWEGGARGDRPPGGATINSGEGRDFLLGGCATQMSCATCHDPHAPSGTSRARDLATPAGDAVCTKCHAAYATPESAVRHTHHAPEREGARCVSCHMPKKNLSLDTKLTAYHRIGSPTDAARVLGDRPLECAVCHRDEPVEQLVSTMERWWQKRYDRSALTRLYGNLGESALRATLARGKPHERAVAVTLLGVPGAKRDASGIAVELTNEIPLVRYYARDALVRVLGESSPIDLHRDTATIARAAEAWLARHGVAASVPATRVEQPGED